MAGRRQKKSRKKLSARQKQILLVSLVACIGLGLGLYIHAGKKKRSEFQQYQQIQAHVEEEDALRQEVEQRRLRAEELARQKAEEAKNSLSQQDAVEILDSPQPPPPAQAPVTTTEQQPIADEDNHTAPSPQPTPQSKEPETPTTQEPPSPPEQIDEPAPQPLPPDPAPQETPQADNPYDGSYSLLGSASPDGNKLWREMVQKMAWQRDVNLLFQALDKKIDAALPELFSGERFKNTTYLNSVNLINAVEFCYLVRCMGAEKLKALMESKNGEVDYRFSGGAFVEWMLTDKSQPLHRMLQAFKINGGATENLNYAINTFYLIWRRMVNNIERVKYLNLAIACSLVHPKIAKGPSTLFSNPPLMSMPELFSYYIKQDSSHKLCADIKKLSISNLLHVVDTRLPQTEFDWVNDNISRPRDKWGSLYESIEYKMENVLQSKRPYVHYTLEEIQKKGGVCVERAYFTAITAKCKGIPAVIITGDGSRGGHAWVGLLNNDRNWSQVGSYGYNTGYFKNPCSLKQQHESDLINQSKNMADDKLAPTANFMLLSEYLMLCGKQMEAMNVARYVCASIPRYANAWRNRVAIMEAIEKKGALDESAWKQLHNELERNVGKNSELLDLAQEVDVNHLMLNMRNTVKLSALKRGYRKLLKPMTGRIDLLLDCIQRQAQIYVESNDKRGMAVFYRQCFKEHAGRGDIYLGLVKQCSVLLEASEIDVMRSLAEDARKIYERQAFSNKSDYFRTLKDADVMTEIAKLYGKAGEEEKSILLMRKIEQILEDSEKKNN